MKAVTIDAAWQLHKDDCLGSLKESKKADLIIVSDNPYKVIIVDKLKGLYTRCLVDFVDNTSQLRVLIRYRMWEITCEKQSHSFLSNKKVSQAKYQTLQTTKINSEKLLG